MGLDLFSVFVGFIAALVSAVAIPAICTFLSDAYNQADRRETVPDQQPIANIADPNSKQKELSWMEDGDLDMTQVKNPWAEMI